MANKTLGTAAAELKLPVNKDKNAKKPKWQAKIGGKKGKPEPVAEAPEAVKPGVVADEPSVAKEPTEAQSVSTGMAGVAAEQKH
ncbi:MAG: hypothetical protein U0796_19180 [Gemmatales bacterium]